MQSSKTFGFSAAVAEAVMQIAAAQQNASKERGEVGFMIA
jgi:hypothetical protein